MVPAGAAIRTYAVRWGPWGCPAHGAIPATTECSRAQGRGQAPVRSDVRCKAVGGDASPSWGDRALVRRSGLSIAITQRVRCGRLVARSTERMSRTPLGRSSPTRGARFPARHPPRLRGSVAICNALPRLAHGRSRLCHPGSARRRLRAAAPTAESGRVARSSGPQGPLHRRPWLRHEAHRRGEASAASEQHQASAQAVTAVRLSAQRSADRSTRPLGRTKAAGRVAPASGWAARHGLNMGLAAPYPTEVAALRGRSSGLLLPGCVLRAPGGGQLVLPAKPQASCSCLAGTLALGTPPGSRRRLPVAATFFSSFKGRAM